MEEARAVAAVLNAASHADIGVPSHSERDIAAWWGRPSLRLEEDVVVVTDPEGAVVAYVDFDTHASNNAFFFDGYVRPDARRLGIGGALVGFAEQWAWERIDRLAPDRPVVLASWTYGSDEAGLGLFVRTGFHEVRRSYRMVVDLERVREPAASIPGVTIRSFDRDRDKVAAYESHEAGFSDHWRFVSVDLDTWYWDLTRADGLEPALFFLAAAGSEIAGGASCTPDAEDAATGFVRDLWVRPEFRRRGIARALLLHAFEAFRRRGASRAALSVDAESTTGALELYRSVRMEPVREHVIVEKELRPAEDRDG